MDSSEIHEICEGKEFHAYGTTRIFEQRAEKIKKKRTWITFFGIVTPLSVGSIVLSFGTNSELLPHSLAVAGSIGFIQLIFATWSVVAKWDEIYDFSINSVRENTELYNLFKKLSKDNSQHLANLFEKAIEKNERREMSDLTQSITDSEKRYANREALRYYQKPCHICKITPVSSKPTKCDSCGNF